MKAVIAIDSLKGSLTSLQAGEAIRRGILQAIPTAQISVLPLADGGEGTTEALTLGMHGTLQEVYVTGPLGKKVKAVYGILPDHTTAVLEMASAAGITLIAPKELNPLRTTTYGVGEMILHAIENGCRSFIIGIGGSATNDGGVGMLQALGYDFLDEDGEQVKYGAEGLGQIVKIDSRRVHPKLKDCTFRIACDVTNPLCGENGCSVVFGPQKGASPKMVRQMDEWMLRYASLAESLQNTWNRERAAVDSKNMTGATSALKSQAATEATSVLKSQAATEATSVLKSQAADDDRQLRNHNTPGAGAAGGMGFAFLLFTNARLEPGIEIVMEQIGLEEAIRHADIVVTGEGRLDAQTVMGKAPSGVAALAHKYHKKVIAFAGCVSEDAGVCNDNGIDAYFPILQRAVSLSEAMKPETAAENMTATVHQVFRLIHVFMNDIRG